MAVKITNQINLKDLVKRNNEKVKTLDILNENDRRRIGNIIVDRIRERTQSGIGVTEDGREYKLGSKPYTDEYAKLKGSTKVDLTLSGDMLENMFVKSTTRDSATISIRERDYGKLRGAEEGILRRKRNRSGKITKDGRTELVKRPFFHLSERDKEAIASDPEFDRVIKRALRRLDKGAK